MKKFLSFINNPKLKIFTLLFILLFIYISINAYCYALTTSKDLSNSVFRLHVIANSDSKQDQELKYIVRDSLINYMNSICENCKTKEETIEIVKNHLDDFTIIANKTIQEYGYNYLATIEIGNFKFPTKNYANISFPSGYYDALKVKIGKAERSKLVVRTLSIPLLC